MSRPEMPPDILHHGRAGHKVYERGGGMIKDKTYAKGLLAVVLGAAGLAEHITSGRGSFPVSAVVLGIGFVVICWSYVRK